MARAWIEDRWLTDAATTAEKRSLNRANDPSKANVAADHRKSTFGSGKRWMVYWMEPLPSGGVKRRNRRFDRKADAEAWQAQLEDSIRSGRYVDKQSASHLFAEAAKLWLSTRTDIRQQSLDRYEIDYQRYVAPRWDNVAVGVITSVDVDLWIASLVRPDASSDHRALKPTTMTMIRLVFTGVLELAKEQHWLLDNPAQRAHWPKAPRQQKHVYLTQQQIGKLVEACDRLALKSRRMKSIGGDGTLILFLACTGLRIGEAAALTVADIDLAQHVVHVTKTRNGANGCWTDTGPTKNGKNRDVPIPEILIARLISLMSGHRPTDPLFRNAKGGWLTYSGWRGRRWDPAIKDAGLSNITGLTPHALRHSYASMLISRGMTVKTVQKLMGHSSAAMTLDVYADLWPGDDRKAADAIDEAWSETNAASVR